MNFNTDLGLTQVAVRSPLLKTQIPSTTFTKGV